MTASWEDTHLDEGQFRVWMRYEMCAFSGVTECIFVFQNNRKLFMSPALNYLWCSKCLLAFFVRLHSIKS